MMQLMIHTAMKVWALSTRPIASCAFCLGLLRKQFPYCGRWSPPSALGQNPCPDRALMLSRPDDAAAIEGHGIRRILNCWREGDQFP